MVPLAYQTRNQILNSNLSRNGYFAKIKIILWHNIFVSFGIFGIFTIPKIQIFYENFGKINQNFWPPNMAKWTFPHSKLSNFWHFVQFLSCAFSKITIIFDTSGFLVLKTGNNDYYW